MGFFLYAPMRRVIPIIIWLLMYGCQQKISYESLEISSLTASIVQPEQERDFTFHEQGAFGVFHNPDSSLRLSGEVHIEYFGTQSPELSPSDVGVRWISSIDGILNESVANEDFANHAEFKLSKGLHTIVFETRLLANEELLSSDSLIVSNVIALNLIPTDKSFKLNWSPYSGDDFVSYVLYRDDFEPVIELFSISDTTFEDKSIILSEQYSYQIAIRTKSPKGTLLCSNIAGGVAGNSLRIGHFVKKVSYDHLRSKLYAIVGEDSHYNDYADQYGLIILDLSGDSMIVSDHILSDRRFADMDISLDGRYLFLSYRKEERITRIELSDLSVTDLWPDLRDWGVHKIEVGHDYRLYCHRTPPTSGGSPLFIVDGVNGEQIGVFDGFTHGDIDYNENNKKLYHSTSTRLKMVFKYSVENDMIVEEDRFAPLIGWPSPNILVSEDGQFVFWENYQLDQDLNIVRELEGRILSIDRESTCFSNGWKLMGVENMESWFNYPSFPPYELRNEVITSDASIIICNANQPFTNQRFTWFFKMDID